MSASLYVKDPAASRYVAGGVREAETLFGTPLPDLPALERDGEHEVFLVHTHHHLRALLYRYLESLLYEITPTDPATYAALTLLFAAVAVGASCLPALRATRIDPVETLRAE